MLCQPNFFTLFIRLRQHWPGSLGSAQKLPKIFEIVLPGFLKTKKLGSTNEKIFRGELNFLSWPNDPL